MTSSKFPARGLHGLEYTSTGAGCFSQDLIHQIIRNEVEAYRIRSFRNFSKDLYVYPTQKAQGVHAKDGSFLGWDCYIFQACGLEKRMRVRLSFHRSRVKVKTGARTGWRSVSSIMEKLDPERDLEELHTDIAKAQSIRMQSDWWSRNKKVFNFLDLPSEIRITIYGFACGDCIEPYPSMRCRRLTIGGPAHQDMIVRQPNMAFFRVNKQVSSEAKHFLYSHIPFWVEHKEVLSRVLKSPTLPILRKLTLSLTLEGYFRVFGYHFGTGNEAHTKSPSRAADHFRKMRLSSLTIKVPPPSQLHNLPWLDDACHVIIVDCLFEAAWEFIRGHPVIFTGFIKDRQLQLFTGLCRVEHMLAKAMLQSAQPVDSSQKSSLVEFDEYLWLRNEDEEEGGVRLDGEPVRTSEPMNINQMKNVKSMPIECKCSPPCHLETWDAEA